MAQTRKNRSRPENWIVAMILIIGSSVGLGRYFHSLTIGFAYYLCVSYLWEIWMSLKDLVEARASESREK